jgi:hypothetical protein
MHSNGHRLHTTLLSFGLGPVVERSGVKHSSDDIIDEWGRIMTGTISSHISSVLTTSLLYNREIHLSEIKL